MLAKLFNYCLKKKCFSSLLNLPVYSQVQLHCGIDSSTVAWQKTAIITSSSLGLTVLIHHILIIFISYCFHLHSYHTLHSLYLEWLFGLVLCELSNKKDYVHLICFDCRQNQKLILGVNFSGFLCKILNSKTKKVNLNKNGTNGMKWENEPSNFARDFVVLILLNTALRTLWLSSLL